MKVMKKQQEQVLSLNELIALGQIPSSIHLSKKHDKLLETVLLMSFLGLRVSEAINFTWQTIKVENKSAFIVQGKGNKQRLVFNLLNNSYINKKVKANLDKVPDISLSRMAVWKHLQKKSQELNLSWKVTPHTLRRSFASILHYDFHLEPPAIQQLLGHSQFRTIPKDT